MQKILVTGGAGYIGSFMVRRLKEEGFDPVIVDKYGHEKAVEGFELHKLDLIKDMGQLDELFSRSNFLGVVHMSSFIQMGESYKNPLKYFENNLGCALSTLAMMEKYTVPYFIFSSSAGVYGNPTNLPIKEDDPKSPENPYGETKLIIEKILSWMSKAGKLKFMSIRYFNAAGAALDGSIGEDHPEESHLIPNIIKKTLKGEEIEIFGNDYDTHDGTNIRDYIHVLDLVETHVIALKKLLEGAESNYYNAGIGKGYSNSEVLEMVKKVTGLAPKVKYAERRKGDANELVASIEKIKSDFDWQPKYGLKEIIETAFLWHKNHLDGYATMVK